MINRRFAALVAVAILASVLAPLFAPLVYPMPSGEPAAEESPYGTSQREHEIQSAKHNRESFVDTARTIAMFVVVLTGLGILIVRLGEWLTAHSSLTTVERDETGRGSRAQPSDTSAADVAHTTVEQMGRVFGAGERAFKSLRGSFNEGRARTNGQPKRPEDS